MDELRSLEGMGALLKMNKSMDELRPKFNRSSSVSNKVFITQQRRRNAVDIINNYKPSSRSYSSRGGLQFEFDEENEMNEENKNENQLNKLNKNKNKNTKNTKQQNHTKSLSMINIENLRINIDDKLSVNTVNEPLHTILSPGNDEFPHSEEESDRECTLENDIPTSNILAPPPPLKLLSQFSNHSLSSFDTGFSFNRLGIHSLNINEIENENDTNTIQEQIWIDPEYNHDDDHDDDDDDDNNADDEKQKNIDIEIERFPSEEFKNYPSSLSAENKMNGSNINIIGTGSFGIVIKSFHLNSCQTVAIKRCRMSDNNKILSLFISESLIYREFIDCKYIIDILGFGRNEESENKLCIALEYMDLGSISRIKYNLDEIHIKYISFSILCALNEIHNKLYIHNDIKPDNILISSRGDVKLSDFGCCTKMDKDKQMMDGDNICGSKQYYAPEKWLISPIQFNEKSDIWSFGITLFEIITLTMDNNRECGYYQSPKINKLLSPKYSKNLCLFLSKMLIWNFKDRWNAKRLMNDPFLRPTNKIKKIPFSNLNKKKEMDLSFMVEALIEYFSNQCFFDKNNNEQYNDKQKIDNLCKHSRCTEKEVYTMIKFAVGNVKRKIDKITKSYNYNYNL